MKAKLILCLALVLCSVIFGCSTTPNDGSTLALQQIVKKTRDAYAALSSYDDTGSTVTSEAGGKITTTTFSMRLQRPNLFRVHWTQTGENYTNLGSWWSDVDTNFGADYTCLLVRPVGQQTNDKPHITWMPFALSDDDRINSWAASVVPEIFLAKNFRLLTQFTSCPTNTTLSEGKIGDVDCHVVSITFNAVTSSNFHSGRTITRLWIGKQDYLLHQIQSISETHGTMITQVHKNILANQKFSMADFEEKIPENKSSVTLNSAPPPLSNSQSLPRSNTKTIGSTITVLSAEFGMGKKVADVTARVDELLRTQPEGFTVNAQWLGQDPLPGKRKHLVIHYECNGLTNVFTIQAGYSLSGEALVSNAGKH